ncbi:MAG: Cyclomaltodextrinase [Clostridiales bacterium]|jgi:glycosidase|nr:Cyclomaltodextrinase [Clostridiales bacterium]
MNRHALFHKPEVPYGYAINDDTLFVKIRVANDDISKVYIYFKDRHGRGLPYTEKLMDYEQGDSLFDYYTTTLDNCRLRFRYYFKIEDKGGDTVFYNERGAVINNPLGAQAFHFPYICEGDRTKELKWVQEGIVYQIIPDRFNNGCHNNDPVGVKAWGEKGGYSDFFGGDLIGITNKLDYLSNLGITIIYLTPIFSSTTYHKYNTKDYYQVDSGFGTKEDLKVLVAKSHERGIRIVLDVAFHHSGHDFFAFQDVIKNGEISKYKNWYFVDSFPIDMTNLNYVTFASRHHSMPKLRMSNNEAKDYFVEVGRHWIRECDIDGWRIDVCDEIDHVFLKDFYKEMKLVKEDIFIVGEITHNNSDFIRGDEMDSTTNYSFREAVLDFFGTKIISGEDFINALAIRRHNGMSYINRQLFNIIDCQDTRRFITEGITGIAGLILASTFQFTYIGVPYIYYGDEIGMEGGKDPDCRRCMEWEEENQNKKLLDHYKKLCQIRKKHKELIDGNVEFLEFQEDFLVFKRNINHKVIIVMINNSNNDTMNYDLKECNYYDIYEENKGEYHGIISIQPLSFKILKKLI